MRRLQYFVGAMIAIAVATSIPQLASAAENSVSVQPIPGQSLQQIVTSRAEESWPWYATRASGLVAGVSLIILMLSGIGSVTGHTFRFLDPLTSWASHRALGIAFVVSIVVHMGTLLFDKFVSFNIFDILVPWVSDYKPVSLLGIALGSFYVALGILAFYGSLVILITSLKWVDKKPQLWKLTHITSYAVVVAVFVHALFIGTDVSSGIGRVLWIVGGVLIFGAVLARLRRTGAL